MCIKVILKFILYIYLLKSNFMNYLTCSDEKYLCVQAKNNKQRLLDILFKNVRNIVWFCINNFLLGLQEEVHKYVQMMGGRVYRDLNISVTHLIAGEVGSKKYLVAANLKKPILLPSWIKTLWEKSQEK